MATKKASTTTLKRLWESKDECFLYSMRADGVPYRIIAAQLGRTVRACERKYQTTDWSKSAYYDPVSLKLKEYAKKTEVQRVTNLQDKRQNLRFIIGDIVGDKIAQAVSALPPIAKPVYSAKKRKARRHSDEDVGLILSDCHIGHDHSLEETGGISEYNLDVFKERANNLKNALIEIVDLHSKLYCLPRLHIFCLGDIVAGMNASGAWSPTYINLSIYDQVIAGLDALSDMIYYWLGLFGKIDFYGVTGNHGRAAPAGTEKEYVNWDLICYKFLQARFANNPNVTFHIPLSWWIIEEIRNHKFLMIHGDSIRGSASLKKLVELEEKMIGIINKIPDYTLAGHFHNSAELTTNHGRVIINGSFLGSDMYSLKDLQKCSVPEQKIFGIHDKRGITWTYNLNLSLGR